MERTIWSPYPYHKGPDYPEAQVPIAYSIAHEWGNLHVSETAHQAYGLIPLTPHLERGGGEADRQRVKSRIRPQIDIVLHGGGELGINGLEPNQSLTGAHLYRGGVELTLALGGSKEDWREQLLSNTLSSLHDAAGMDSEEALENIRAEHGEPLPEYFEQKAPQIMAHVICGLVESGVNQALAEWLRVSQNKQILRRVTRLGYTGLAIAGGLTAINAASHPLTPESLVMPGGYIAGWLGMAHFALKGYLSNTFWREQATHGFADTHANFIAASVHEVYCSQHFNEQIEGVFNQG